jgi:hypothetical protein
MRIRTVLVAAVLAAVAVLPLAALASAEPMPADRNCRDIVSRAAAHEGIGCEDEYARRDDPAARTLFASAPPEAAALDATPPGLLGAGLGAMAATAAGYLVVRRTPARSRRRRRAS